MAESPEERRWRPPPEMVLRLGAATLIGCMIGRNRSLNGKPEDLRTAAQVTLGPATVTADSIRVSAALGLTGDTGL